MMIIDDERKHNTLTNEVILFLSNNSQDRCDIHKKKLVKLTQETKGEIVAR